MTEQQIKTVLDVADALHVAGPNFSKSENTGGLIALARGLNLCGDWDDREKNIEFLARLIDAFGLTDGADSAERAENKKRFLIGLALELSALSSDNGRAVFHYGPDYSATELDHDLIIDLYKDTDVMTMLKAAVDAISKAAPLVVIPDELTPEDTVREHVRYYSNRALNGIESGADK